MSPSSRSIVASIFDDSTPLDLSPPVFPVLDAENWIMDGRGDTTPTLLPEVEYIVPSGVVLDSLKTALARMTKLQTVRETQFCIGGKGKRGGQQDSSTEQKVGSKVKGSPEGKGSDVPLFQPR
jgi:hypothetical protein